jgi:hypothetical protein
LNVSTAASTPTATPLPAIPPAASMRGIEVMDNPNNNP